MADRIVILGARPGRIRGVLENHLPRPRDYRSPELTALVEQLHDVILGSELPDAPPPAGGESAIVEPLPDVAPSEIVGLLEYLDLRGGGEDLFRIAADTSRRFDQMIAVVKAAELVDLVDTPKRRVVLAALGRRFLTADAAEQKRIWRERLLTLRLIRDVNELLARAPGKRLEADVVRELIALRLPQEDYERLFDQLVRWARFGDLFDYDEASEELSLAT